MTVDNTTKHHPCAAALAAQMKLRGIPSQMQLTRDLEAAGLKTSQSTLSLALAGKTPDLSTASKLATFFDVPATTFMPELAVLVPQTAADTGLPRFPLERTRLAKHNERTHYVEEDIHILAADLRDRGLMQNLVGYLDGDVAEVYGGGRRWRALRLLALWGELPDDLQNHGIPFKLYDTRLECLQATVAENAQREDVHFLDRAAALARIREEGGLKAAKIARDLHLGERLVQQLLQIHDRLPDWARDRAFLPKDDPNHLKFRDCRDLVEEKKAAPDPEQEKGADVPLPLAMPAQRFTPDQVAHAAAHLSTQSRPDAEPVSARLRRVLATLHPGADRYGPGDMVWEALPGLDGLDAALAKEFGITTDFLEIHESTTLGSLARWIISQMSIPAPAPVVAVETTTPAEDSTKLKQQMELARAAASGSSIGRGGADGTPVEFFQRAPYLFCSINMPGLNGADLSRIAVGVLGKLEGHTLPQGAQVPPEEDEVAMRRVMAPLGARLLRRIVDNWGRFPAVLKAFRGAMKAAGHTGRGADLFGTQLACAHLVLSDAMPTEDELAEWARKMKASELAELSNDLAANRSCLLHLQSSLLDAKKGGQSYTAGYWIQRLLENEDAVSGVPSAAKDVRDILRASGLDVKAAPQPARGSDKPPPPPGLYLWVANRHQGVGSIFRDSAWKARPGTAGPWVRQLASLDGAIANVSFFCDGVQDKAVLIPIHYCQESTPEGGQDGEHGAPSAPGDQQAAGRSPDTALSSYLGGSQASARSAACAAQTFSAPTPDPFAMDDPL